MDFEDSPELVEWDCVVDARAYFAETPLWDVSSRMLFWIDTEAPTLNRTDPDTRATTTWKLPRVVGGYAIQDDDTALVALTDGLYELDFVSGSTIKVIDAPYDREHYQFNDGRCDPVGRYWTGTFRVLTSDAADGQGHFYRLDESGLVPVIDQVTIANGLAFSPDGDRMYMADRPNWQILAFDYDVDSGTATNRRQFVKLPEGWRPDGAAVDADGYYWSAMFAAGRIVRFAPDGTLDRLIKAPVTNPTMVAFGGDDLQTLYLTTSRAFLTDDQLQIEPDAGGVFACRPGVAGLPEPRFTRHATAANSPR